MLKKWTMLLLALLLCFCAQAWAEEITIEEVRTQMGENAVVYPQLKGMEDTAVQQKINDDIVTASGVTNHMVSLFTLTGQQTLNVTYEAYLNDDIFSAVISAKGRLPKTRDGHSYTALTYDLKTGERVTLDRLFTDVDAAVALMEEKAIATLSEELNGYLEYSDLTPLPLDSFTLNEDGITFWYPADQFSLISGYSGACQFWYEELEGLWAADPTPELSTAEQKTAIEKSISSGILPRVPVQMGQNMQEIADAYRLLRTPDEFPGGRYFLMEHPAFRSVLLISDSGACARMQRGSVYWVRHTCTASRKLSDILEILRDTAELGLLHVELHGLASCSDIPCFEGIVYRLVLLEYGFEAFFRICLVRRRVFQICMVD